MPPDRSAAPGPLCGFHYGPRAAVRPPAMVWPPRKKRGGMPARS